MKSSNEEFQSVTEELQISNEELETSKEELQSINEELETVNAELNSKVDSLDRALSDQKNLLENTEIATIFLDDKLRIKSFTSPAAEIFRLIETDLGRPITDISTRLAYEHLPRDVSRVLRTLSPVEEEVSTAEGSPSYIMRILPYRTVANVIHGVVVTFLDITERKRDEEALARLAVSYTSTRIRNPAGKLLAAAVIERDITRRKQAEEQQKVLVGELNHRVKNALATVLSIASRTRKTSASLNEYYHSLEGRLRALASTHDILARNVWAGAELRQILLGELKPYDGEKDAFQLSGPDLFVSARAAVVLGMVFHELATNAAKYGALADSGGN